MALLTLKQFYDKTNGKAWANYAGTYRGQCVSLVSQYLNLCFGLKPGAWGNAVDYKSGGTGGNKLKAAGFTWYRSGTPAKDGDILVWGDDKGNWTGPYGHIAIWYKGKIYDQNYAGRLTAGLDPFFDAGYLGKWRPPVPKATPKPAPKPVEPPKPAPIDYAKENNKLLNQLLTLVTDLITKLGGIFQWKK